LTVCGDVTGVTATLGDSLKDVKHMLAKVTKTIVHSADNVPDDVVGALHVALEGSDALSSHLEKALKKLDESVHIEGL